MKARARVRRASDFTSLREVKNGSQEKNQSYVNSPRGPLQSFSQGSESGEKRDWREEKEIPYYKPGGGTCTDDDFILSQRH